MRTESHIFVITIAHAKLALAQQRVHQQSLDFGKVDGWTRGQAIHAADELEQAIKAALTIETTP